MNEDDRVMIPDELILNKIYLIRGQKVMLDNDLAELYGVETKQLKRAVRRNINDSRQISCLNFRRKNLKT